jgi:GTP cyclohydrolase II
MGLHDAERALFDLRQGRPLYVTAAGEPGALIATVDGLAEPALETLRGAGPLRLAVTLHRATSMGLVPDAAADGVRGMSLSLNGEGPEQILHLAIARGRFSMDPRDVRRATTAEVGGLTLARLGRLLPAVVSAPAEPDGSPALRDVIASGAALSVASAQIDELAGNVDVRVTRVSEGQVPLADAEYARFVFFREAHGLLGHVAVLVGQPRDWADPTPVRIHSACLTGDLFGSLRCDCGEQLRGSLRHFAESGGGVLLYMGQEGRDIGLANKLRAYTLQEHGLDTVDADGALGFGADEREYDAAVEMLKALDVTRVRLLTNNPAKVEALRAGGIDVLDRRPLYGTLNRHNLPYVTAKMQRAGHWLADMLSGSPSPK